jgi:cation diffusion facilitator CzcD-associated flavoprotein CzcO
VSAAPPVVIVGTGMAGYGLARELRRLVLPPVA